MYDSLNGKLEDIFKNPSCSPNNISCKYLLANELVSLLTSDGKYLLHNSTNSIKLLSSVTLMFLVISKNLLVNSPATFLPWDRMGCTISCKNTFTTCRATYSFLNLSTVISSINICSSSILLDSNRMKCSISARKLDSFCNQVDNTWRFSTLLSFHSSLSTLFKK